MKHLSNMDLKHILGGSGGGSSHCTSKECRIIAPDNGTGSGSGQGGSSGSGGDGGDD